MNHTPPPEPLTEWEPVTFPFVEFPMLDFAAPANGRATHTPGAAGKQTTRARRGSSKK